MNTPTISLNIAQETLPALPTQTDRFKLFTFSKNFERLHLKSGFEQNAPSAIATALNVTRIAPAVFFVLEKLSRALETILNAGVSLLNCAYSALLDHDVVELDVQELIEQKTEAPSETIEEKVEDEIDASFEKIFDDVHSDVETVSEESIAPSQSPVKEEAVAEQEIVNEEEVAVTQDDSSEETTINQDQTVVQKDELDEFDDFLVNEPTVPGAPSNTNRYLAYGAGALALATVGFAAYYFDFSLPNFNFFGNNTNTSGTGADEVSDGLSNQGNTNDEVSDGLSNQENTNDVVSTGQGDADIEVGDADLGDADIEVGDADLGDDDIEVDDADLGDDDIEVDDADLGDDDIEVDDADLGDAGTKATDVLNQQE